MANHIEKCLYKIISVSYKPNISTPKKSFQMFQKPVLNAFLEYVYLLIVPLWKFEAQNSWSNLQPTTGLSASSKMICRMAKDQAAC